MKTGNTRLNLGIRYFGLRNYTNRKSILLLTVGFLVGISMSQLNFTIRSSDEISPYSGHQYGDIKHSYINEFGFPIPTVGKHNHSKDNAEKLYKEVRVLCWVMTNPDNHHYRAIHIKNTWGKRCNKVLFMSSETDQKLEVIALPVGEGRNNLWGKTREAFKYIYKHHINEYDWFLKADDDTYVVVENLRYMLYPYDPKSPLYFGCRFNAYVKQGYMSGGAGYVLSREALRRLVEVAMKVPKNCRTDPGGAEDVEMGKCMENVGVIAGDSRDSQQRGRFFPFVPEDHLFAEPSDRFWYWKLIYYKTDEGLDCCSDYAITFHYVAPNQMYGLDYLIYYLSVYGIEISMEPLPAKIPMLPARANERYDNHHNNERYDNHHNNERYDNHHNNERYDNHHNNERYDNHHNIENI